MSSAVGSDGDGCEESTDTDDWFDRLAESPPSVKLVYYVLKRSDAVSQPVLAEETLLPERTIRYALKRLEDVGIVRSEIDLSDPRRRRYRLTTVDD